MDDERGRRDVAQRVPVLARRDDLRRHARRCSATSSRAGCSSSGATNDRRRRARRDGGDACAPRSRTLATADERADVDAVLAQLGWLEMLDDEPADAIDIVFGALGATNATATALDDVLASALGTEPRADLAVLLPRFAAWDPPGRIDAERSPRGGPRDGSRRHRAASCWWSAARRRSRGRSPFRRRPRRCARCTGSIPTAGLHAVRVQGSAARATRLDPAAWQSAVALGRRAVAHQIAGASRAMLDLARTHALERVQFGRPIARFQAVRHRLADALVAVEALEATLDGGQGGAEPRHGGAREGRRRTHGAHGGRDTASRCSPASASPRSIRSTASSSGRSRSRDSSDRPTRSFSTSDGGCSPRAAFRRSSSCEAASDARP